MGQGQAQGQGISGASISLKVVYAIRKPQSSLPFPSLPFIAILTYSTAFHSFLFLYSFYSPITTLSVGNYLSNPIPGGCELAK